MDRFISHTRKLNTSRLAAIVGPAAPDKPTALAQPTPLATRDWARVDARTRIFRPEWPRPNQASSPKLKTHPAPSNQQPSRSHGTRHGEGLGHVNRNDSEKQSRRLCRRGRPATGPVRLLPRPAGPVDRPRRDLDPSHELQTMYDGPHISTPTAPFAPC